MSRHLPGLAVLLITAACAPTPPATTCTPLGNFPGPEDFDLVELEGRVKIIASARDRRDFDDASRNGFWSVDPQTGASERLEIHGRDGCWLAPHGIATQEVEPGRWELWAILHFQNQGRIPEAQPAHCDALVHAVERYRVEADGLHFVERLPDPEQRLTNPNELDVLPDGRLWLSNNPPWVANKGLAGDVFWNRAKGQVLGYAPAQGFYLAADNMVFPNGIYAEADGETLWVSAAHGKFYRLQLDEQGRQRARDEFSTKPSATLDNFWFTEDALWITGHPKGLAFIRHTKNIDIPSPTAAYRIDTRSGEAELVGYWAQGEVSGGATVVPLGDRLVLSQAFSYGLRSCAREQGAM